MSDLILILKRVVSSRVIYQDNPATRVGRYSVCVDTLECGHVVQMKSLSRTTRRVCIKCSERLLSKKTVTDADKRRARKKLNHAIASGLVVRQPCRLCGARRAQAHHEDYRKPLDVDWLCAKCHSILHNQKHPLTKRCAFCEIEFTPHPTKRERQVTCSRKCFSLHSRAIQSLLTHDQCVAICLAYKSGNITMKALGIQYGISRSCIGKVINGKASYIASVNEAIAADVVAALTRH